MAWTPHGYHIPGTVKGAEPPEIVERCGGPFSCLECMRVSAHFINIHKGDKMPDALPVDYAARIPEIDLSREYINWSQEAADAMISFRKNTDPDYNPAEILRFFAWQHLPSGPAAISRKFHKLAVELDIWLSDGPEKSVALRKLLEAKDAAVRSVL